MSAEAPSARFYHLTRSPLEAMLPPLIARARGAGWRVAVRAVTPDRLAALDDSLWLVPGDGFLPHGVAGGPFDADQPVLLTLGGALPNGATCLMAVEGAQVQPAEAAALARVCVIFDGTDPAAVAGARAQWKALTDHGIAAQYWSEESGRWQMKSERVVQTPPG